MPNKEISFCDQQWMEGLVESEIYVSRAIKRIFTQIIILGSLENPKRLWECIFTKEI